ncbi:MAG: hypothetical protein RRA35_08990, partial [Desulfomonilia bacterium]|nr:hypothetical protein [Desulfomonilia bacterium]
SRSPSQGEHSDTDNMYLDLLKSILEKNRKRVDRYYCASSRCPVTFFSSDLGYQCPECGAFGVISEYKTMKGADHRGSDGTPVIGFLDSIGRMFCLTCASRLNLEDDVSFVIYDSTEPFCRENCDSCRAPLKRT